MSRACSRIRIGAITMYINRRHALHVEGPEFVDVAALGDGGIAKGRADEVHFRSSRDPTALCRIMISMLSRDYVVS
jgi:hypothetical protein